MKTNNRGFGAPIVVLLVVILGLIGLVGYYVYSQQDSDSDNEPTLQVRPTDKDEDERAVVPDGWMTYKSDILGVEFSYPGEWGQVKEEETDFANEQHASGKQYTLSFSGNDKVQAGSYTADWSVGRGGAWFDYGRNGFDQQNERVYQKVPHGSDQPRFAADLEITDAEQLRTVSNDVAVYAKTADAGSLDFLGCSTHSYISVNLKSDYAGFSIAECGGSQLLKNIVPTMTVRR